MCSYRSDPVLVTVGPAAESFAGMSADADLRAENSIYRTSGKERGAGVKQPMVGGVGKEEKPVEVQVRVNALMTPLRCVANERMDALPDIWPTLKPDDPAQTDRPFEQE